MDMNQIVLQKLEEAKNGYEHYSIYRQDEFDRSVGKLVLDNRTLFDTKRKRKKYEPSDFISELRKSFYVIQLLYGEEVVKRLDKITSNLIFQTDKEFEDYGSFSLVLDPKDLKIAALNIPNYLEKDAYIFLTHEFHHILKDTNKEEVKYMFKYAEVIPLFYELIIKDKLDMDAKSQLIGFRNDSFNIMSDFFSDDLKPLFKNENDREDFLSLPRVYFISYYFAVLLYSMYLDDEELVLSKVKKVLSGESTTKDMLDYFELFKKVDSERYLNQVKLILR